MTQHAPFSQVVDAVDALTAEEQEDLIQIVRKRLAERGRQRVLVDCAEATAEYETGGMKPTSVDSIMGEIDP